MKCFVIVEVWFLTIIQDRTTLKSMCKSFGNHGNKYARQDMNAGIFNVQLDSQNCSAYSWLHYISIQRFIDSNRSLKVFDIEVLQ